MKIEPLRLSGVFLIKPEIHVDHRGLFARTYCEREFENAGLIARFVQCNTSFNEKRGTLRGMHFAKDEGKLVRCTRGSIYDVVVDLRRDSSRICQWLSVELSEDNRHALYIPPGFAHGFQTLTDQSEVFYQMTAFYQPELARGVRWNDPAFSIQWPIANPILSERDLSYEDYRR